MDESDEDRNAVREIAEAALTEVAARTLIESYEYLKQDQIITLVSEMIENLNYVTANEVTSMINDALANLNFVTDDELQNHANSAALARQTLKDELDGSITELTERIDNLQDELDQLQAAVQQATDDAAAATLNATNAQNTATDAAQDALAASNSANQALEDAVTALTTAQNAQVAADAALDAAGPARILGSSTQSLNGWAQFNFKEGIEAMGELCRHDYANSQGAHACTMAEVHEALSAGNFSGSSISFTEYWAYPDANEGDASYCMSMLYSSAHAAVGTSYIINTSSTPTDGAGNFLSGGIGVQISYNFNQSCGQSKKVLCCR